MIRMIKKYADQIGISGSVLCLIHCTVLPLFGILSAGASSTTHGHTHFFVGDDLFFALVAIVAAYFASKNTQKPILKILFWIFSILFSISLVTSEIYQSFYWTIYLAHFCAFGLIVTHAYHFLESRKRVGCQLS